MGDLSSDTIPTVKEPTVDRLKAGLVTLTVAVLVGIVPLLHSARSADEPRKDADDRPDVKKQLDDMKTSFDNLTTQNQGLADQLLALRKDHTALLKRFEDEVIRVDGLKALLDTTNTQLALSRTYVAATMPGPQNMPTNSNRNQIAIQGLQANISSKSLPALVVASVLVSRATRRESDGTMDLRINGVVRSMVEPSGFGHRTDHTYVFTTILQPNGQASVPVSVSAVTFGANGPVLSGSLVVIPLGQPPT
jgi:hypothetical protein